MTAFAITFQKSDHFICAVKFKRNQWIDFYGLKGTSIRQLPTDDIPMPSCRPRVNVKQGYVIYVLDVLSDTGAF